MKKQNIFIVLLWASFMLLFFANVTSAENNPCAGIPESEVAACVAGQNQQDPMLNQTGGPNNHHGVDCAALPSPEEVAACWDTQNAQHHDPNMPPPDGEHHDPNMPPPGPGDHPDCPAGKTCGGPNDHHGDQEASQIRLRMY